jgi:enoyl-[acyl-carrier protein] reductase III
VINLNGKVALVTGGTRGIGKACAEVLVKAGAEVIINYRADDAKAEETANELINLGKNITLIKGDVSQDLDCKSMFGHIAQRHGRLDVLVHNAASGGFRNLLDATPLQFDAAMHTNALSLLHLMRHARALMIRPVERSKVIVLSSAGTHRAIPAYGLVGASKAALAAMIRQLAVELGPHGINLNIVEAGLVDTDSTRQLPFIDTMLEARTASTAVGARVLEASDVANCVLFLSSPLSDLIQGQTLIVDAGASIRA